MACEVPWYIKISHHIATNIILLPHFFSLECFRPKALRAVWLFMTLEFAGASSYLVNFVKAWCSDVCVFVSIEGSLHFSILAQSGVLTGCLLSASLFVIASSQRCVIVPHRGWLFMATHLEMKHSQ